MNPWDKLRRIFNIHQNKNKISPDPADNILIAWPSLFESIQKIQHTGKRRTALDFGCGAGSFAGALYNMGYRVEASDTSKMMWKIGGAHIGRVVLFRPKGTRSAALSAALSKNAPFALITSVMVLQFIKDVEVILHDLDAALAPGGLFAFAVYNPDHVRTNTRKQRAVNSGGKPGEFTEWSGRTGRPTTYMHTHEGRIHISLRSEDQYHSLFEQLGYKRVLLERPCYGPELVDQYPTSANTHFSQYIVMLYQKSDYAEAS